jgi:hypothetical protein
MTAGSTSGDDGAADPAPDATFEVDEPVEPESVSLDVVFDILSNSRRRLVLSHLDEVGGESTTSDLAEFIAAVENGKPQSELTSQERKRVYVGIYQTHLPKMDDADVVDVDDRGTVTLGPNAEAVYQFLETSDESPWPKYYAAHTGLSGLALVAAWLFFQSSLGVLFALSIVVYAAIVGLHARSSRA